MISWLCWTYLCAILALWLLLAYGADRWWIATVAMFAPVWIWPLPLAILVPFAAVIRRRTLYPLVVATLVIVFPVSRLCVPWRLAFTPGHDTPSHTFKLRTITLNGDGSKLETDAFLRMLSDLKPSLVILQSWNGSKHKEAFGEGWHVVVDGELCVVSRHRIVSATRCLGPEYPEFTKRNGSLAIYEIATPAGTIGLANVHLFTPREGLDAALVRDFDRAADELRRNANTRRDQSRAVRRAVERHARPFIIAGDFNTSTKSIVYGELWSDLTNAFSHAGWGLGHTHFTMHTGVRIDHILVGPGWHVQRCWVGPEMGSAHRPVIADLELPVSP
jgi:endonuclease/exonuclease/phosphatase (EEP) superfamily protein YafD